MVKYQPCSLLLLGAVGPEDAAPERIRYVSIIMMTDHVFSDQHCSCAMAGRKSLIPIDIPHSLLYRGLVHAQMESWIDVVTYL